MTAQNREVKFRSSVLIVEKLKNPVSPRTGTIPAALPIDFGADSPVGQRPGLSTRAQGTDPNITVVCKSTPTPYGWRLEVS